MTDVGFRLFGSPVAYRGARTVALGGRRDQRLISALLLHKGEPIDRAALLEWVWDQPDRGSYSLLTERMAALRRLLTTLGLPDALDNRTGQCRLHVPAELVDIHRFNELVDSAWQTATPTNAIRSFRQAFDLYREPFGGLDGQHIANYRVTLSNKCLRARIRCAELELGLGHHDQIIPELCELGAAHPRNEQIAGLRMLAHYRAGDQATALDTYHDIRLRLKEEIGVDVGNQLVTLQQQILNQESTLDLRPRAQLSHVDFGALLRLIAPDGTESTYPLTDHQVTFGRPGSEATSPDIVLDTGPDSWISRDHCWVEHADGQWWVTARGKNDSFLCHRGTEETARLERWRRTRLRDGDAISFPVGPDAAWRVEFSDPVETRTATGRAAGEPSEGDDQ